MLQCIIIGMFYSENAMNKTYIVIPVFNEESIIGDVLSDLKNHGYGNLLVVDDGSTDHTWKILKHFADSGVKIIRHRVNLGKGAAVKTAIAALSVEPTDTFITFDGDGQHNVSDLKALCDARAKGYDVVLGNRFNQTTELPAIKRFYNFVANSLNYFLFGLKITDSQSGLRAYSGVVIKKLDLKCRGYEFDTEILMEIKKHNFSFTEIPVKINYSTYSQQKLNRQGLLNGITTLLKLIFLIR